MKKLIKILSGLLVVVTIIFFVTWQSNQNNDLTVHFFDVGQGDGILIRTASHQNIIIDGGPDNSFITKVGQALPFYDKTIDLIVITHPHDDHIFGLVEILKRYQVKQVLSTGVLHTTDAYLEILNIIEEKQIPMHIALAGQKYIFGKSQLTVIFPFEDFFNQRVNNLNDTSVVVQLSYDDVKFLFMGDLEVGGEEEIIESSIFLPAGRQDNLKSNVLKLGHHGSDTSSSQDLLNQVYPDFAVIQVGEDNKFGHPSRRIIKRLERMDIEILRTDILGDINLVSDGHKTWLE